ncbi:hypothetical protein ZWY2020_029548 [Hordeum vulgare]|nr:hypothetical protein ZWY2020_029548 [Hordeum vulgare]
MRRRRTAEASCTLAPPPRACERPCRGNDATPMPPSRTRHAIDGCRHHRAQSDEKASKLHLKNLGIPYLSAYLNSIGSNFSQGANFATAGSTISRQNTSLFLSGFSPISLDVQSWEFEQFINRSQFVYNNKGGIYRELLPKAEYFTQALYTFDIGQNDLTAGYFANMTTDQVIAPIPELMERIASIIKCARARGRNFWIHSTGPIGCLPTPHSPPDIAAVVAQLFNQRLKETVACLRKTYPDAAHFHADAHAAKYKLISQASNLGFDDPLLTCCGTMLARITLTQGWLRRKVLVKGSGGSWKVLRRPVKKSELGRMQAAKYHEMANVTCKMILKIEVERLN